MQIHPTRDEFIRLAKQGNVIPVYGRLLADFETPVSAFVKLDDGRFSYLLESVEGKEKVARFSFLGSRPRMPGPAIGSTRTTAGLIFTPPLFRHATSASCRQLSRSANCMMPRPQPANATSAAKPMR